MLKYMRFAALALALLLMGCEGESAFFEPQLEDADNNYNQVIMQYLHLVESGDFEELAGLVFTDDAQFPEGSDFLSRNRNIYTGIGAANIQVEISGVETIEAGEGRLGGRRIDFRVEMDTSAGRVEMDNSADVYAFDADGQTSFLLHWDHDFIFPGLEATDKVQVSPTDYARRGTIYDRNDRVLAGNDKVYSVCLVPGKMADDPAADIQAVAEFLGMTVEAVQAKLDARPMADENDYVELKRLPGSEQLRIQELLDMGIAGVLVNSPEDRVYPRGAETAHLVGYMAAISAEELEQRAGQGYTTASKIGKAGMELLLEERLRGVSGRRIVINDAMGNEKQVLAEQAKVDGEDIKLTIDSQLQSSLYEQMKDDKGAAVVMNYETGEVLALLSTPAYDPNAFILGFGEGEWAALSGDERQPMYNRFRGSVVPGSSFKPIIAAIGLDSGAFSAEEDFGGEGTSWQPNSSWGNYTITTLVDSGDVVTLNNAMINSDNIYFSKAALKIGGEQLAGQLASLGFGEELNFPFGLEPSSFGGEDAFQDEIELADSGHGQGRILVNPVHMASMYSALRTGNMLQPYLVYIDNPTPQYWKQGVFSQNTTAAVCEAMVAAVENPAGTAHAAQVEGIKLAGKTGTGEIKASRGDESGTEVGWFCAFRMEGEPLLFAGMVEDVKGRGGSGYVLPIGRSVFATK